MLCLAVLTLVSQTVEHATIHSFENSSENRPDRRDMEGMPSRDNPPVAMWHISGDPIKTEAFQRKLWTCILASLRPKSAYL